MLNKLNLTDFRVTQLKVSINLIDANISSASSRISSFFVNNIHMSVMNVVIDLSSIIWTQPTHRSKHHHIMIIFMS